MSKKYKSKRKNLGNDMRFKGYDYVIKEYSNLSPSFYKKYFDKCINNLDSDTSKIKALINLMENQLLPKYAIDRMFSVYESFNETIESFSGPITNYYTNWKLYRGLFWETFSTTQKFSEQFFLENLDKMNIIIINNRINPWARPENQSEELKVFLMLKN